MVEVLNAGKADAVLAASIFHFGKHTVAEAKRYFAGERIDFTPTALDLTSAEPQTGVLKVGPRSAGAVPGPACYGAGGAEPTVTDANLVLGRLNPDYFLGGRIRLDADAALEAVSAIGEPLGITHHFGQCLGPDVRAARRQEPAMIAMKTSKPCGGGRRFAAITVSRS